MVCGHPGMEGEVSESISGSVLIWFSLRLKYALAPLREISPSKHIFLAKAQRVSEGAKRN
jgi:hypothetical protein